MFRAAWFLTIAALLLVPAAACAAAPEKVYKCTDAGGGAVFSETPCGSNARQVAVDPAGEKRVDAAAADTAPEAPTPANSKPGGKDWAAFKCSTARGMVFYRYGHCPKSIGVTRQQGTGDVQTVYLDTLPVEELGVTLPTACDAMYGRSAAGRWGKEFDERQLPPEEKRPGIDLCGR
jgi:Domain of unknown function (DUF4124)